MKNNIGYVYLVTVYFAWSTMQVTEKYLLDSISPFTIAFFRFIITTLALLFLTRKTAKPRIAKGDLKYFLVIGILGYFINIDVNIIGIGYTGASLGSLVGTLSPVFVTIVAALLLKERITKVRVLCLFLAVGGAVIISGGVEESGQIVGIFYLLLGQLLWAFTAVCVRRLSRRYDAVIISLYGVIISLFFHVPAFIISAAQSSSLHLDVFSGCCLVYLGLVCTTLPILLWNKSLSMLEASTCSLFSPLQPFFATVLGCLILHETINRSFILGAILIFTNVVLNYLSSSKKLASISFGIKRFIAAYRYPKG